MCLIGHLKILQNYPTTRIVLLLIGVFLQCPKVRIFYNFKEITLDSLDPLILMKRRTLNNISQVFVIHLCINTSFQPYEDQNYIIMDVYFNCKKFSLLKQNMSVFRNIMSTLHFSDYKKYPGKLLRNRSKTTR